MRIVNLETFLKLPPGTVYAKYEPQVFDKLEIKQETCKGFIDWFAQDFNVPISARGSDEEDRLMQKADADPNFSVPLCYNTICRDGCFEKDQLFAIFEEVDVHAMIARLHRALAESGMKPYVAPDGRCPEIVSGERCGFKAGHDGKHGWVNGD